MNTKFKGGKIDWKRLLENLKNKTKDQCISKWKKIGPKRNGYKYF